MEIHYFNCDCQDHYGDYLLYLETRKLFKSLDSSVEFVDEPENADLLLFGGGTVLGMFYWRKYYRLDKPVAVFGSGIATEKPPSQLLELLRDCDKIGVRGRYTQQVLDKFNVESKVVGDPVFSMNPPQVEKEPGLAVGGIRKDAGKHTRKYFRKVYSYLEDRGYHVELYRMGGNDRSKFHGYPVRFKPLGETIQDIGRSELVAGMRLHMTLTALCSGVKTVGFEYAWRKMEDALSVLDYPYYVRHLPVTDDPLIMFQPMYETVTSKNGLMEKIQSKINGYRELQHRFAGEILEDCQN